MEQKDKISIIIPVYNVEKYVDECIESVIHQTYRNLEIILVDDGSKDQSGRKCDLWAEKDARIRVIHQENRGISDARNIGMAAASGNYIGFVDGDDMVFPDMYTRLYESLIEGNAQISCCKARRGIEFPPDQSCDTGDCAVRLWKSKEAMKELVLEGEIQVTVWNKLYLRSLLAGLAFEKDRYHEDEFWTYQAIARAERIVSLGAELYGYRQRENSVMTQHYSLKHLDLLDARASRLLFLEKNNPELIPDARCNLRFECIRAYQLSVLKMSGEAREKGKRKAMETALKYPLKYADYRNLPYGKQVWCFLSVISFPAVCYIRNWFHFGP